MRTGVQYRVSRNRPQSCSDLRPCQLSVIRPEESTNVTTYSSVDTILSEGETQFNSTYVKSVSTEIVIDRKFT